MKPHSTHTRRLKCDGCAILWPFKGPHLHEASGACSHIVDPLIGVEPVDGHEREEGGGGGDLQVAGGKQIIEK